MPFDRSERGATRGRGRAVGAPVAVGFLLLASCGDDPVRPSVLPVCSGAVEVSVSEDADPTITWTPACRLTALFVTRGTGPAASRTAWHVWVPDDGLAPGIPYGTVPTGGVQSAPAAPLGRDTTYWVSIGMGGAGPPGSFESVYTGLGSAAFTACGALTGGSCRTTAEKFSASTAEGLSLTSSVQRGTIARGDTAWVLMRLSNATGAAVTVATESDCWRARGEIEGPLGAYPRNVLVGCESPSFPLTIQPGSWREWRLPFTGRFESASGVDCVEPGTWRFTLRVNAWNGGLRVASAPAAVQLVERASARVGCRDAP